MRCALHSRGEHSCARHQDENSREQHKGERSERLVIGLCEGGRRNRDDQRDNVADNLPHSRPKLGNSHISREPDEQ